MPPKQWYPNNENYPFPSFDSPAVAPSVDPDEGATVSVAFNPAWTPYILGALDQLVLMSTWQGTEDEIKEAVARAVLLKNLFAVGEPLAAPYWDDPEGDDASDPEDNPAFPFYEDAAAFVIAGFVAYAAGIGAALEFWTIQRQFRIAVRKTDVGGIIRAFIDAVQVGEIDTYSPTPDLAYMDIISPGSLLRLEVVGKNVAVIGEPVTQIIRKRLWEGEGIAPDTRWSEDCDCVQTTFDGGETWVDTPGADPRNNPGLLAPPSGAGDPRCSAAQGMIDRVEAIINAVFTASALIDMANAIFAIITVTVPGFGILVRVIFLVCEALVAIGIAALQIEFTEEAFEQIKCIFYVEIDENGQMDAAILESINTRICEEMSVTICAAMGLILNMIGFVPMSNFGALYEGEYDCEDCPVEWCNLTDFTTIQGDYIGYNFPAPGIYTAGVGWVSQYEFVPGDHAGIYNCVGVEWVSPVEFKHATFTFNLSGSYSGASSGVFLQYKYLGTWYTWGSGTYDPPIADDQTIVSPEFADGTPISGVRFIAQLDAGSGAAILTITSAQMRGFVETPFTEGDDCL